METFISRFVDFLIASGLGTSDPTDGCECVYIHLSILINVVIQIPT